MRSNIERIDATATGLRFLLLFHNVEVVRADLGLSLYFHFLFQPPHADGCFQLLSAGRVHPGLIWGCACHWSACGRYLAADWGGLTDGRPGRHGVLIDLQGWRHRDLGPFFNVQRLEDGAVHGKDIGGNPRRIPFAMTEGWVASMAVDP